jgi:PHP family Zn ribbon phosphoesterase
VEAIVRAVREASEQLQRQFGREVAVVYNAAIARLREDAARAVKKMGKDLTAT